MGTATPIVRLYRHEVWQSPALMSLFNTGAKIASFVIIIPLVLNRFSSGDVSLYLFLTSIISLQMLVGGGFAPTFSRFISHALAGMPENQLGKFQAGFTPATRSEVDPGLLSRIVGTLRRIFLVLALGCFPCLLLIGTTLFDKPIRAASSPELAWIAWGIVAIVTPLVLYSSQFSAILQGANEVAAEQRWSAIFVTAGAAAALASLFLGGNLLVLIAVNQTFQVVAFFRLSWLASRTLKRLPYLASEDKYSASIFRAVWPNAWRSLTGVWCSAGIAETSGLAFAETIPTDQLAQFQLVLRIIKVIAEVSRAPFYSHLPVLNRLRAKGDMQQLRLRIRRNMIKAHLAYIIPFAIAPSAATFILPLVGSHVGFPELEFWFLLGLAVFVERWGAMHLQAYSTTNNIIWHWLNGLTGAFWVFLMIILTPSIGVYSYPVGLLGASCFIYTQVSVRRSLGSIGTSFWDFELRCTIPAIALYGLCCGCQWMIREYVARNSL